MLLTSFTSVSKCQLAVSGPGLLLGWHGVPDEYCHIADCLLLQYSTFSCCSILLAASVHSGWCESVLAASRWVAPWSGLRYMVSGCIQLCTDP